MATIRADGRTSWFSDTTTASGDHTTPGIAVANSHTLGGWWWVKTPNGRSAIVKQIDWGPAHWTGRTVDVHSNALHLFGYNGSNFPTDGHVQAVYLGRGVNHAHRQAARLGLGGAVHGGRAAAPAASLALTGLFPAAPKPGALSSVLGAYVPPPSGDPAYWGR